MDNIIKTSGTTEQYKLNPGGAVSYPFAVKGIVKQNVDTTRTGRIKVYIEDFGATDPSKSSSWVTVSYLSPFYGNILGDYDPNSNENTSYGTYTTNPHSYGFWATSPDIGSEVICLFLYGKKDFGYYIGCVPKPGLTHMVPAIGSTNNIIMEEGEASRYGNAENLPVTELNDKNENLFDSPSFNEQARPVHKVIAAQLWQQGLVRDEIRGTITSSSVRESPSNVYGISTPGRPIYSSVSGTTDGQLAENLIDAKVEEAKIIARRGGHSLVLDDGDIFGQNNLMRLRTAGGHQITMSDDGQTLFIIHSNGQSYVELGKEGTIDLYSTNSFNVRTKGDLNLHADNNININAKKQLNIYSEELNLNTDKNTNIRVGKNFSQQTIGDHLLKVDKGMSFASKSPASFKSDNITFINGSRINLNTGTSSLQPVEIKPLPIAQHSDTLFDSEAGWIPAPSKLPSINSRVPTHTPWVDANKGVDVKIDESAASNFPTEPSSELQRVNATTIGSNTGPLQVTTPSLASTAKNITPAKGNFDVNTTSAAVSQAAVSASNDPAIKNAVSQNGGLVTINGTQAAVLGKLGHSPLQLEQAGYLKPGSSVIIDNVAKTSTYLGEALPQNVFTGKDGVTNLPAFVNNVNAQTNAQVGLMNNGFDGLKANGVITGKESPTQITGLLNGAAKFGVSSITSFASATTSTNTPNTTAIKNTIATGNYAANMAEKTTSPVGSMLSSITSGAGAIVGSVAGAASSVFNAIKGSFTKLTAGIPQNLTSLNSKNTQSSGGSLGGLTGGASAIANQVSKLGANQLNLGDSSLSTVISQSIQNSLNFNQIGINPNILNSSLANFAKSSLNGPETSALNSASKALSSSGPGSIVMPTVAENTVNRSNIQAATKAIYGDSRIPLPNSDSQDSNIPNDQNLSVYENLQIELNTKRDQKFEFRNRWFLLKDQYGSDAAVTEQAYQDYKQLLSEIETLRNQVAAAEENLFT
jgi:hypothetical protein